MAYDGNGNFLRIHNWAQDAANGVNINAPEMDGEDNGFAAGLSLAVTRDGQGKMSSDFLPNVDNALALGSAIRRWTTLNGIPISTLAIFPAQTPAEIAAGVVPVNIAFPESTLYRYGSNTVPGTTDMTSAMQNAALVAAFTGKILIPHQDAIKTTAATTLPSSVTVSGGGYFTNLLATTTNQTAIFTTSAASNVRIENIRFIGSNTSTGATANGNCLQFNNSDHIKVDRCWFSLFRSPPVFFNGDSGTHNDFLVQDCYFFNNQTTIAAGEVTIYGTCNSSQVVRCRFEASVTAPFGRGVFIADLSSALNWTDITVDGCTFIGHANNGICTDEENPASTFRSGIVNLCNNKVYNSIQSGFKLKNSYRTIVTGNYFSGCDTVPEVPGSQQGAIFINACWDTTCSDNIIINTGTDGIRSIGLNTGSGGTAAGAARSAMNINNNIVESAGQAGIITTNDVYESNILGNSLRNSGTTGIAVVPGAGTPGKSMIVAHNNVRGTGGSTAGINVDSVTSGLTLSANQAKLCGGYGISVSNCADVVLDANIAMDNGQGAVNTSGIKLVSVTNVIVSNNRAGNNVGTTQGYGLEIGASVTGLFYDTNNNLTGNQTGPDFGISLPVVASAATVTLTSKTTKISGTTNITSITAAGWAGQTITLIFQGVLTVVNGNDLKLSVGLGNFTTAADATLTLLCDGGNFFEIGRSTNA
jgi:parallel beta-helix repeat protein